MPLFRNFRLRVHDIIEDATANKVVVWARGTADTDVGPYRNEYVLMVEFNDKGDKVTRVREFLDSGFAVGFFARVRRVLEERERERERKGEGSKI